MVQPRDREAGISQAVFAVQTLGRRIDGRFLRRTGSPQTRQTRRIQLVDNRLHVAAGLLGRQVALHGRDPHQLEPRVEQSHAHRHGIVDAGIAVDDHLPCHSTRL